jgi:hypothetical protein
MVEQTQEQTSVKTDGIFDLEDGGNMFLRNVG